MEWFRHNSYAEWYYNTIRLDGSPAQLHHQQMHGGCDYDDFLDQWQAENSTPTPPSPSWWRPAGRM